MASIKAVSINGRQRERRKVSMRVAANQQFAFVVAGPQLPSFPRGVSQQPKGWSSMLLLRKVKGVISCAVVEPRE
jgi:hypothetical protein